LGLASGHFTLVSAWFIGVRQQLGFLQLFTLYGNNGDTAWGELQEEEFLFFSPSPFMISSWAQGLGLLRREDGSHFSWVVSFIFFGVHEHEEETKKENRVNGWLSGLYGWLQVVGLVLISFVIVFFFLVVFPMFSLSPTLFSLLDFVRKTQSA
jgi:hypothetical protein